MTLRRLIHFLLLSHFSLAAIANPNIDEILQKLSFTQQEKQQLLQGKLVTTQVKESTEHELAVMLAFTVKTSPEELKNQFIKGTWIDLPEQFLTYCKLPLEATKKDFSTLKFSPFESDEINIFLTAKEGTELNLNTSEIDQFQSIRTENQPTDKLKKVVEEQLQAILLQRFQAYLTGGVNTIQPYQREHGQYFLLGEYFKNVTRFDPILQEYYPDFYQVLLNYPSNKPAQMEEAFFGLKLEVENRPTFTLMHRMVFEDGDSFAISIRQFYVSQSYNGEQNLGLFIPIKGGGVVIGLFRISSDAVAGVGSAIKHSIGRRLLTYNLTQYYEKVRRSVNNKSARSQ